MKSILKCILVSTLFIMLTACSSDKNKEQEEIEKGPVIELDAMQSNALSDFDLVFLQLNNDKTNKVYSPISIKYALGMLLEGANGESYKQIADVLGTYTFKKYKNSNNVSFANALFVNDKRDVLKETYKESLQTKFNAAVEVGDFSTPSLVNNWVSDKTFNLIKQIVEDISNNDFVLVNALAIDMDWKKVINPISFDDAYRVSYPHIRFYNYVDALEGGGYHLFDFTNDETKRIGGLQIAATINKYDIVTILGEENIRQEVGVAYDEWISDGACGLEDYESTQEYLDHYIKEIDSSYGDLSSSTDFEFYDDETVKMFAKDLKVYDELELQYIGIMPKTTSLENFVAETNADEINTLISKLRKIDYDEFETGYITRITGGIPLFKYDYELNLVKELQSLGIVDVFDVSKADLSNLSEQKEFIDSATHKTTIEFSNEGITAAAAATLGGMGADGCYFEYMYEPKIIDIDLTFNKPFVYLIRDKKSNEVWFIGEVYQPSDMEVEY